MNKYQIVLGSLFGDEGKGVTVNWLCKQAMAQDKSCAVVRYSNGPQNGHTVVEQGIRHVFSTFGSGSLLGCDTIYKPGVFIDPVCYANEYKVLTSKGIIPTININPFSRVISPYDVLANRLDKVNMKHGSCGKGVYKAKSRPFNYHFRDLAERDKNLETFFKVTAEWHQLERIPKLEDLYKDSFKFVKSQYNLYKDIKELDFDTLVYEGTQGLLLDADKGFLPHVTATTVVPKLQSFPPGTEVYLVCRSYLTRHGNYGSELQLRELPYMVKYDYTNVWNKYQGSFYKGLFDIDLLSMAFQRHELDKFNHIKFNLVITHCDDVRDDFEYIVNSHVKQGSLTSFIKAIKNNVNINFDNIYINNSEESNLTKI